MLFPTFWSPSDTPLYNLEPCEPLPFDVARFRGLTASLLLDLTYLTSIHEDAGKLSARRHEKRHRSNGGHDTTTTTAATTNDDFNNKTSETEHQHRVSPDPKDTTTTTTGTVTTTTTSDLRVSHSLDEVKAHAVPNSKSESEISSCALDSQHQDPQEDNRRKGHGGSPLLGASQSEIHAVQMSYLYLGAMKALSTLLSCSKYVELLLIPKVQAQPEPAPSGHNADLNAGSTPSGAAPSPVCQEEVEMRAALQFLMRHMVKRAVMRSPIKRALGLADLERAQAMIYKLVVSGMLDEHCSGGKSRPADPECEEGVQGEQQAQTPITTSPSASSTTSFMSSSLEDTTTATTPVTDTETVPASESPGVMPLSLLRQMFSSYPTTTLLPTRRAQTPPVSSLPTSPSDEVGRRQSLSSPETQTSRPANRTGTCMYYTHTHVDIHTHT
ncbi:probable E3 ubiquitin-protein ligase HERC1 [Oncorhynchus masou masou]|uniref:probable E3 ubiquitin-protein ligase HERC1 n=1 Tax=Oncorhynchus masou masou TaxID=90313 RepID=UPI0031844005